MSKNTADKNINISITTRTIFIAMLIMLGIWVVYMVQDVLLSLFLALVLALALEPLVHWLQSKGLPRSFSVIASVLVLVIGFVSLLIIAIIPFTEEVQSLVTNLPVYTTRVAPDLPVPEEYSDKFDTTVLYDQISATTGGVVNATLNALSGFVNLAVVVTFTIYLLIDFRNIRRRTLTLFPVKKRAELKSIFMDIEHKLGSWLRGQLLLMIIIGVFTYIGLVLLGVDYALALAVIAALLEIVPIIGPIIAVIPAALVGFMISPLTGFGVIGLYTLLQQLENQFIVPKVMERAVGFNPLVTIIALMVGGQMFGIIGALLAVPFTIIFFEVTKYILNINAEELEDDNENKDK